MKKIISQILISLFLFSSLSGCGRDLSNSTYTSESTLNIVLQGKVLAKRDIKIKENERLTDNTGGAVIGAVGGGLAGAQAGGNNLGIAGGALAGGVAGAVIQSALSTQKGVEYIVQVDNSSLKEEYYEGSRLMRNAIAAVKATGIITIVQDKPKKNEAVISEGQNVLVIISDNRTRVVPAAY